MPSVIVTCEHGGNRVPRRWQPLFRGRARLLSSHRGWDPGALELARRFGGRLFFSTTTRLLCDLNRSLHHRALFSEVTRPLPREERERILARHWHPYREQVAAAITAGRHAIHLAVHTFTPVMRGKVRQLDVGLLYDPARAPERDLCRRWRDALKREMPGLRVRMNAPYRGTADGFPTFLRRQLPASRYVGIELEVSQRFPLREPAAWRKLQSALVRSFRAVTG